MPSSSPSSNLKMTEGPSFEIELTRADESAPEEKANDDTLSSNFEVEANQSVVEIVNLEEQVKKLGLSTEDNATPPVTLPKNDDDCSTSTGTSVSFGSVQIREYERVIDSSAIYMGLSLGWNYHENTPLPLREKNVTSKYSNSMANTSVRGGDESRMKRTNGSDRYGMLLRYGYVQKELRQATKEAAKFYKQRQREAARSLVVAEERNKKNADSKRPKLRPLLRSMFG